MNKTKRIITGVASALICAALITGSAYAISVATASPMETTPIITEASTANILANNLNVVAVAAKSSENNSIEGTPVLVQNGTVTVSGQDNKTWKIGDEGLAFESGYEPVFSEGDGIVTVSEQGMVKFNVSEEGGLGATRVYKLPFIEGVPGEDDITAETAVETATRTIQGKYALTDETLARFTPEALLNVANPDEPVWSVVFNPVSNSDFSEIGCYSVTINANTGEISSVLSAADGIG